MKTVHHIELGAKELHDVDAAHAVGNHPFEWSFAPWTDEARNDAMPKLREKRKQQSDEVKAQRAADLEPYDPKGGRVVSPMAGQTGTLPAGGEADALTPAYAMTGAESPKAPEDDGKAADVRAAEEDAANAERDFQTAEAELNTAYDKGDEGTVKKAEGKFEKAQKRLDEAKARVEAVKK